MKNCFAKILVSASTQNDSITEKILDYYNLPYCVIPDDYSFEKEDIDKQTKRYLILKHSKGNVVKSCPGTTKPYICCQYHIINQTLNCPVGCTYCILQYYLDYKRIIIYTDFDKIFWEIGEKLKANPKRFYRIGSGELGDSLALYGSRLFAKSAISYFSRTKNAIFEIKSKMVEVDELLSIKHNEHTVFSWSLNPQIIINNEEGAASPLADRLKAAKKVQEKGFLLGFHFDPIIIYPHWKILYAKLIEQFYAKIEVSRIVWISLGSLRFPLAMKNKIIANYPQSKIVYGEFIRGQDNKLRYARPLRAQVYQFIYNKLIDVKNPPFIYFCMENPLVWKSVMGFSPYSNSELDLLFALSIQKRFKTIVSEKPLKRYYRF